jgi:hypothetical protein
LEAEDFANFSQIAEDATRSVNPTTCAVGMADEIEKAGIFLGVIAYRLVQPGTKKKPVRATRKTRHITVTA